MDLYAFDAKKIFWIYLFAFILAAFSFRADAAEETKTEVVERAVTVADIENIDKLNLDDFSCDFSKVEIPKGDITDDAMDDIVNQFFSGLEAA